MIKAKFGLFFCKDAVIETVSYLMGIISMSVNI